MSQLKEVPDKARRLKKMCTDTHYSPEAKVMMLDFGCRRIFLCDFDVCDNLESVVGAEKFVILLPASNWEDVVSSLVFTTGILGLGCREVCCAGQFSNALEDAIDAMLEADGRVDVVTTSFMEEIDALEYVLFAAGGAASDLGLVAVVGKHASLEYELVRMIDCA